MVKFKIYDGEDTIEAECELLAVCGLSRPGSIVYQFRTDFAANRAETFALLAQISAQLQAASIDAMREAEKIVKAELNPKMEPVTPRAEKRTPDPDLRAAEDALRERLGTKVSIQGSAGKGKLVIEYYTKDQLSGLYDLLIGE